jgi:hypothetical protein
MLVMNFCINESSVQVLLDRCAIRTMALFLGSYLVCFESKPSIELPIFIEEESCSNTKGIARLLVFCLLCCLIVQEHRGSSRSSNFLCSSVLLLLSFDMLLQSFASLLWAGCDHWQMPWSVGCDMRSDELGYLPNFSQWNRGVWWSFYQQKKKAISI